MVNERTWVCEVEPEALVPVATREYEAVVGCGDEMALVHLETLVEVVAQATSL